MSAIADHAPDEFSSPIADELGLLDVLMADSAIASPLWQPTAYWRNYSGRIVNEIRRVGLGALQSNHRISKGYGPGGAAEPFGPSSALKRAVWQTVVRMPVFDQVIGEYRRLLLSEHRLRRSAEIRHAAMVLDLIAESRPDLRIPGGIANGSASDTFEWRGHQVTASWVEQLARLVDFYDVVPAARVERIIEIGPGIGLSTLAHKALNPNLKAVINVDIVPVLYVSTQFLRSTGEFDVVDYSALRDTREIRIETGGARPRLLQMPPWLLPRVVGSADYFFNAFSFQEMELDICGNYVKLLLPMIDRGVLLHSSIAGKPPGAGGQRAPVTMEFLVGLFDAKFRTRRALPGLWTCRYRQPPERTALFERA